MGNYFEAKRASDDPYCAPMLKSRVSGFPIVPVYAAMATVIRHHRIHHPCIRSPVMPPPPRRQPLNILKGTWETDGDQRGWAKGGDPGHGNREILFHRFVSLEHYVYRNGVVCSNVLREFQAYNALRAIAKLLSAFNEIKNKDSVLLAYYAETEEKDEKKKQAEKKKEGRREDIFKNPREHDRNYDRETLSTNEHPAKTCSSTVKGEGRRPRAFLLSSKLSRHIANEDSPERLFGFSKKLDRSRRRVDDPHRLRVKSVNCVQIDIRNDYHADEHNSSKVAFTALDRGHEHTE
uniref:Uncharacterized protein n=1 Tax=Vespula pensylvanica TaxID=30213 RepID=A0A834KPZ6_VESPE|nr:hypothetical protein H0235_013240 [Vespula pensylvanica]